MHARAGKSTRTGGGQHERRRMTRDPSVPAQAPHAGLPAHKCAHRIHARVDAREACMSACVLPPETGVGTDDLLIAKHQIRRPIVVAIVRARRPKRDSRAKHGIDPPAEHACIAIAGIRSQRESKRRVGFRVPPEPVKDLAEACERFGIRGARCDDLPPRLQALLKLTAPRRHTRQSLLRVGVPAARKRTIDLLGVVELPVPRQRARVLEESLTVSRMGGRPQTVHLQTLVRTALPGERLRAPDHRIAIRGVNRDDRIIDRNGSGVLRPPGQRAREGEASFRIARLERDVPPKEPFCVVQPVAPRAKRRQTEDRSRGGRVGGDQCLIQAGGQRIRGRAPRAVGSFHHAGGARGADDVRGARVVRRCRPGAHRRARGRKREQCERCARQRRASTTE